MENKERAVCYIRLSQDDSKNPSLSPMNQEKICREYAESKTDKINEVYKDIKSGSNLNRRDFQRMMKDARAGMFKRIYAKKVDRISRDIADMENTIKELTSLGIILISCDGNNDPRQRQMFTMLAQWQIEEMRDKTEMQHSRLIKNNESVTRPALGYVLPIETQKFLPNGKRNPKFNPEAKKVFVIDEKKAEIIRGIFQTRAEGKSINKIAEKFRKPIRGIYLTLQNQIYIGVNCYKEKHYPGLHKPIISNELFDKVQKINKETSRKR